MISSDWESIKGKIEDGGVSYADEKQMEAENFKIFLAASIGWARYKPLLLYVTHRNEYDIPDKGSERTFNHSDS